MWDFLSHLFDTSDFPARWTCGSWTAGHGWLHILSDLGVWSAYIAIPCVLCYFALRKKDVPFRSVFLLFGAFILACGTTHLMEAVIFWWPAYRLAAVIKLFTALISWATVIALVPVTPKALALRTPDELEAEIVRRKEAEEKLQGTYADLERQVRERTLALNESEERHRLLVELHPDAILVNDGETVTFANPAAANLLGRQSPDELLGRSHLEFVHADFHAAIRDRWQKVITTGNPAPKMDQNWLRSDGTIVPVEVDIHLFPGRSRPHYQIVAKDVTEQRRSEGEYRRLAGLLDQAYDPNLAWQIDGVISFWNHSAEELYGYTKSEAVGKTSHQLLQTVFPNGVVAADVEDQLRRDGNWEGELIHTAKDGRKITVESRMRLMGEIAQPLVLEANRDITNRKSAEEALRQSESRFRQMADTIPQLAWMAQPDGHIYWYNKQWYDYTGTTPEAMEGWGWQSVHDPAVLPKVLERWMASIATGKPFDMVFPLRGVDGHFRSFLTRVAPLRSADGQILQWFGTNTDISERMQMEEELRRTQVELEVRVQERTAAAEARAKALAKSEAALREQTQLMEAILNSMGEGVAVAGVDGRFILFNPAAEAILGVGLTDASPDKWSDLYGIFHSDTKTPFPTDKLPLVKAIRGEATDDCELYVRNAKVPGWYITVTGRPMLSDQGTVRGGVAVFRDITARKQAEAGLKQAKEIAESANRAKSEFLAHMSHEIRTPMNGIIGMTELALDTSLNAEQREYLSSVKQSADALLTVINDILDFSKIEAGMLALDFVPFRLRDSLGDMLKPLALRAHRKGLELVCHVLPDVPNALHGDKGRLRQIIVNLVGNAIKFTERGEVVIHVEVHDKTDKEVVLHVWVADTGIGIAEDKQSAIFAPFEQADNSTARRYGGTGLGLTISARLIEMMDGRTWLKSTVGQGSAFHFTARLSLQDSAEPFLPSPEAVSLEGVPVLIVEDNATALSVLVEMLRQWGMKPTAVATETLALEELSRATETGIPFSLVLLDTVLPDRSDTSLAEQFTRQAPTNVPIILMLSSADHSPEVNSFYRLTKPIKQSKLLDVVQEALAGVREGVTGVGLYYPAEPVDDGRGHLSQRPLRILLAEDNIINQKVAVGALAKAGHSVFLANNGREAVNALESDSFDVVLMDVQMPEMDGLAATRAIREREKGTGRHVPIIALTAHAMKGDRERFLATGMDECVTKPIRQEELWRAIESCIPVVTPPEDKSLPDGPGDQTLDRTTLLARVGGNVKLLTEILRLFITESPRLLGELHEAVSDRNADRIQRTAHTLKGTLGNLSASDAFAAALRLEELSCGCDLAGVDDAFTRLQEQIQRFDLAVVQFVDDLTT